MKTLDQIFESVGKSKILSLYIDKGPYGFDLVITINNGEMKSYFHKYGIQTLNEVRAYIAEYDKNDFPAASEDDFLC